MSQAELARRVGITRSAVNQWVKKGCVSTPEHLFAAADALGCSPRWLATGRKE